MTPLILALIAGAVAGVSLGALGAGGSILTVPALIYLLGFTPAAATTASLVVVIVTSVTALVAHARAGTVRWRAGLLFAAAGVLPAAVAGALSARVPEAVLTVLFAALAALAGLHMLRRRTPPENGTVSGTRAAGAGAGLGAVTGFLGVGGGFLAVPALVTVLAVPMSAAVGTSLLVVSANALVALAGRAHSAVHLDLGLLLPFLATAVLGAWDGRRLATKVSAATLRRVFGAVLLAVAVAMGATAVL
ncbi:sulfite exporter TauE/SafE family protein [Streptomyces sp. NPDC005395]|uniref:Probable membrane transporter protein n=1 Tax=Streptomyces salinarius TaxID=2762598 RepID=A0ABW8BC40_9ACTN|nr:MULTISPECIES: sulfite exporter TauE/SafE family protein [unclassified Streptomyces]WST99448.1 sulfite exporter TauE/SafE family protein [Streptomyces sp. NBC_01124]AZM73783.1 sulfite exporter TauE/SafE family protein [Streptomyces sp. KPB2]MDU0258104.1 sulfite exporter TauE/SafE family protein [Streptomyces sp. PU10]QKW59275.1 sulfite exporter TauE/SafE family protein [Streptomyces sp. NA03103]QUW95776.1 putative membrane transporter protein [Streptomyces sp. V17-9]